MKNLIALLMMLISTFYSAQFTSPGNGTSYTLSTLSAAAPTVLVNNGANYTMTANITISAGDTLLINENTTLIMNNGVKLTISGTYNTTATDLTIKSPVPAETFNGIQFDASSTGTMKNTTLEYGGGIRVSTGNFLMENCIVRYFKSGLVTGGTMSFSTGSPIVKDSQFIENDFPAFSSAANATVSATFQNNYLFGNSKSNTNRPQINMGPAGNDSIKILNNQIMGIRTHNMVGGIAVAALIGGPNKFRIQGNTIKDNRYGITIAGTLSGGYIKNNIIENNDTQGLPLQGGSGIAMNSTSGDVTIISGNQFRGNLWGITLQNNAQVNLGDDTPGINSPGQNIFFNNANGGQLYALYNNTPSPVSAKFNCWRENELSTPAMVEAVISHQPDDSTLGLVTFTPFNCAVLKTSEVSPQQFSFYPNPGDGTINLTMQENGNIVIRDTAGRVVLSKNVIKGLNEINSGLNSGNYLMTVITGKGKSTVKLIIKK